MGSAACRLTGLWGGPRTLPSDLLLGAFIMSENQPELGSKHHVRIHIDQERYESPNPTTGEVPHVLGRVPAGYELYREVSGDQEDKPIPNGKEQVQLREDEHFHSGEPHKKEFTIIVNARKKTVTAKELTFEQIVALPSTPFPPTPFLQSPTGEASTERTGSLSLARKSKSRSA